MTPPRRRWRNQSKTQSIKARTAAIHSPQSWNLRNAAHRLSSADHHAYVTSAYGAGSSLFKVSESGGKFSVEQVYANKVMENHYPGVVKVGDYVYGFADGKQWICQDFLSGNNAIATVKIVVATP